MTKTSLCTVALLALLVAGARPAHADDVPEWPSEQQDRLAQVSDEIIQVMRERRQARFENDEDKLKQLDEHMKDLNDEKVDLLRAMGELE